MFDFTHPIRSPQKMAKITLEPETLFSERCFRQADARPKVKSLMGQSDLSYLRVFSVLNWPDEDEDEDVIILCWTMIVWWFCCDWGEGASCIIIYYRDLCMVRMLNTLEIRWTPNSPNMIPVAFVPPKNAPHTGASSLWHHFEVKMPLIIIPNRWNSRRFSLGTVSSWEVRWRHHHFDFCISFCRWYED